MSDPTGPAGPEPVSRTKTVPEPAGPDDESGADTDELAQSAETDRLPAAITTDLADDSDADSELFDLDEQQDPDRDLSRSRRPSVISRVLIGAVLVVSGFIIGVSAQRNAQSAAAVPILTGTVQSISGNVLQVADSSAAVVAVTVPDGATVSTFGLAALAAGTPVAVTGTRTADGSVVATTVTTRRTGR